MGRKKNHQSQHPMISNSFDWFNEFVKSSKSSCSFDDDNDQIQYKMRLLRWVQSSARRTFINDFGQIGSDLAERRKKKTTAAAVAATAAHKSSFKIEIHAACTSRTRIVVLYDGTQDNFHKIYIQI